ncbi:hypothetical protein Fmac_015244 [Flemingia macrophylla]|uniref:Uncharacterized protein n=1 Tax=Flemingia macrophylla TaxID=520843 RepID=A0ABD1ME12_9FABA
MSILRRMLQTPIADHYSRRYKALDREDASQLLAVQKLEGKLDAPINLVTQLAENQKPASIVRVYGIRSSNDHHTSVSPSSQQSGVDEHPEAYAANTYSRPPQQQRHGTLWKRWLPTPSTRKLEGKLDALVSFVTQLVTNQKPAFVARGYGIRSSNDHHSCFCPSSYARNDAIVIRGVHDVATDTSAETRKLESKLDALVSLVTQLAANQKPAFVARFSAINDTIVMTEVHDVATNTSAEARKLEGKLDALLNLVTQLAENQKPASIVRVYGIHSSNDHHTSVNHHSSRDKALYREDGSQLLALEGKLNALVSWVTQLAANQKPASVARVCHIRSSNDHHTSVCPSSQQSGVHEHPEAYAANTYSRPPQQGVHDMVTDTSAEDRKLEGKLDALQRFVTQLAANQKPASIARVSVIHSSNDHHTSVCLSSQQYGVDENPEFSARNDAIVIRGVHDMATDTVVEDRKLEGKLDALVSLVAQLAANQKSASVARVCGIRSSKDHQTSVCPSSQQSGVFSARNDAIVIRGVHDVPTDTSAEARKLEVALASLVTQLATNQKSASVARVYDIRSSNDHHTSVCPSSQQSGLDEHPEAYATNTYSRRPQAVHDVATDTSAEARKLEGKLDALLNLVTQLAANLKPASVARVYGIRSSNDHLTSVYTSAETRKLEGKLDPLVNLFSARNDVIIVRGVHDVATDTSAETRKLEGKLNALVNLVTQLAVNQKPASVERVCGIRSSNDHHTSVCPSLQQSAVDEHPEFSARNYAIVIRGVRDVATDTSVETRKLEGKLDALVNLVTHVAANQKSAPIVRVCGIRSSNDHHTSVCPTLQQSGVDEHPEAYAANTVRSSNDHHTCVYPSSQQSGVEEHPEAYAFSARNDVVVIRGVHDVATDTSAETRKLEGKLDALVNLVTQLAANQKPASVARVCGIRSSNDHHTSVYPSSLQSGMDKHREAYAANTYRRRPQQGVHNVATDTSAETRKLEGKLDALVNLVAELAANQKSAFIARVCGIRSSNDHHTSFSARNDAILIRVVHGVATDTSAKTRKLEGKLDNLVSLVTQLAANQKAASIAKVYGICSSNDHHTSACPFSQQCRLATNQKHASVARVCAICSSNDHHTSVCPSSQQSGLDEHPEAYVLGANQKHASVARVYDIHFSNDHHTSVCPSSHQSGFSARNDAIVIRRVHDVATDTSAETRKLEGKLDALVNLVTQLAVNQKPASVARVCDIGSSNDHHTSFSARNDTIVIRRVPDVAIDPSAETRTLEGKLDAIVNLVTYLAVNQKPATVARVCGIRSFNDHHTSTAIAVDTRHLIEMMAPNTEQFNARNDDIFIRGVQDVATDTSPETRKLEGNLDALVNLVTHLDANQKPASIARVCDIRSSNDHHTSVCPSSQHSKADEHPEAYAVNTYSRPPQQ